MPSSKPVQKKSDNVVLTQETDTKKSKAQKTVAEPTQVKKETKKTKSKKEEVVEVAPATPEVEVVVNESNDVTSINSGFTDFITRFQGLMSQFNSLKGELKLLERKTVKQLKVVQKINNKKKKKGTRAPSGFVKPAPISNELAKFLGKPEGSEMARTDVTREINKYIRAHNLQDKENGRKIIPDKSLTELLKLPTDVNLTYFNLQRYMGPHFPKQPKVEAV